MRYYNLFRTLHLHLHLSRISLPAHTFHIIEWQYDSLTLFQVGALVPITIKISIANCCSFREIWIAFRNSLNFQTFPQNGFNENSTKKANILRLTRLVCWKTFFRRQITSAQSKPRPITVGTNYFLRHLQTGMHYILIMRADIIKLREVT